MSKKVGMRMTKKIPFINFKGSLGKTTLTAELASRLVY